MCLSGQHIHWSAATNRQMEKHFADHNQALNSLVVLIREEQDRLLKAASDYLSKNPNHP
jgi:hypothetical protein